MTPLRLGTRGSQLALAQATTVAKMILDQTGVGCEIVVIRTSGDRLAEAPLSEAGGKRLFVKEIEDALLAGTIDIAVHSSKDMPALLPAGLSIGAVLPREDARDAVVLPLGHTPTTSFEAVVRSLGAAPRIGTSSIRRTAQLRRLFPGARFLPVRGNLDTRLRKLDEGGFDALVLAAAGLRRLGRADRISLAVPAEACVPAPGQGIVAVEIRSDDRRLRALLEPLGDPAAMAALAAERAVVVRLGGGCQMPIGAYAVVTDDRLSLRAVVASPDGERAIHADASGAASVPETIGTTAAERLLEGGASEILSAVERAQGAVEGREP